MKPPLDGKHEIWQAKECLSDEAKDKLIQYQWDNFKKKLNLNDDPFKDVESLEEIDQLMREPTRFKRPPK